MSPLMNASCASGSSQPIEAFGRVALLVEARVEVDRLDGLGRVERGLPGLAVLGGDLAAGLPDRRQVVVLGQPVERDRVDPAALLLDRRGGRLELVPRRRRPRRRPSRARPCGRSARARRRTRACPRPPRRASPRRRARRRSRPSRWPGPASNAPWSANSGVHVVPISATSGTLPPAIAVVNLSWACAHGHELDLHLGAWILGLEVRRVAVEDLLQLRRARVHDPGRDRCPRARRRPAGRRAAPSSSSPPQPASASTPARAPAASHLIPFISYLLVAHPRGWDD